MLEKNRYQLVPKLLSKEMALFLKRYLEIKKRANIEMRRVNFISPFDERFGMWGDPQVPGPNTFILYGDPAFDLACDIVKNKIQAYVNKPLYTTYSYARLYVTGDELKRHTDRNACEISASINLGGDPWPLYIIANKKKIKVDLTPGNGVIYHGLELPHWREPFEGKTYHQFFLHYSYNPAEKYDKRKCLGVARDVR